MTERGHIDMGEPDYSFIGMHERTVFDRVEMAERFVREGIAAPDADEGVVLDVVAVIAFLMNRADVLIYMHEED